MKSFITLRGNNHVSEKTKQRTSEKQNNNGKAKNGSKVAQPLVITTMMNLEALMESNPMAFYELVEKCKNSEHKMFGNTKDVVAELALIDSSGSVHSSTKDVVLSAVEGEGLSMSLSSPVAPKSTISSKIE